MRRGRGRLRDETWINAAHPSGSTANCTRGARRTAWSAGATRQTTGRRPLRRVHRRRLLRREHVLPRDRRLKVALVHLVGRLIVGGYRLLDAQFHTEHLAQFGIEEIAPRAPIS